MTSHDFKQSLASYQCCPKDQGEKSKYSESDGSLVYRTNSSLRFEARWQTGAFVLECTVKQCIMKNNVDI